MIQTSPDEVHLRVFRLLEANPELSQRALAVALELSLGKTNYCLKAMLDKGLIKVHNFRNCKNKAAYAYCLTPAGIRQKAGLTTGFLKRKLAEYEALKREIELLKREVGSGARNNG